MDYFEFLFPLALIGFLLCSYTFVYFCKKFLYFLHFRRLFPILYSSVFLHEVCHFVMALICLKWPKYEGIKVEENSFGYKISGGVSVKVIPYKTLIYNIVNGSYILETLYLLQELIAGFFIGFAPEIIPLFFLFLSFNAQGISFELLDWNFISSIFTWQYLFALPLIFYVGLIASPSWADIRQTLPLFFILFLIPVPLSISNFLLLLCLGLILGTVIILFLWIFIYLLRNVLK